MYICIYASFILVTIYHQCEAFMVSRITTRGGWIIPHSPVPLMFEEGGGGGGGGRH